MVRQLEKIMNLRPYIAIIQKHKEECLESISGISEDDSGSGMTYLAIMMNTEGAIIRDIFNTSINDGKRLKGIHFRIGCKSSRDAWLIYEENHVLSQFEALELVEDHFINYICVLNALLLSELLKM